MSTEMVPEITVVMKPLEWFVHYARNPRKNDAVVDQMCASIREFGFRVPVLAKSDGTIIDGHLRAKAALKLTLREIPVILCDDWSDARVKAFRLLVNRSVNWAEWDNELLKLELEDLKAFDYDLSLTGFEPEELEKLLRPPFDDEAENAVLEPPVDPVTQPGDLWLLRQHRLLCGDSTNADDVNRLLSGAQPSLMVTDPPYGIELDSEWRDRAGLNSHGPAQASYMKRRTEGHKNTTISEDTRADWSDAFALVPSLQVAYVWHASKFTREVLDGLLRIGFVHHQQIVWDKGRTVLTRTHYWFQHEPCWYVRKKNAPWFGKAGENSTIWFSPSPKFIMGGSDEEKFDHPTQKPVLLMRKPILNHTQPGEIVYEPFSGSGTTLVAAETVGRVCLAMELDPQYADLGVLRWQQLTGQIAILESTGLSFEETARERGKALES